MNPNFVKPTMDFTSRPERYFLLFTPGRDDLLVLDGDTITYTFCNIPVIEFARNACIGEARFFGPQLVIRLDPTSVVRGSDGSFSLHRTRATLDGKTTYR